MRADRGLAVSRDLLRRQIAAMPCLLYEVRLIHNGSRQAYPGVRQWTAFQLLTPATVAFLRIRNREGYDVYFRPYAGDHNAGYILLDLDQPTAGILARLRSQGHAPCVVVETSPGRWQAWIRVSPQPLPPALATLAARRLAQLYGADRASADWRHLGRLTGFTNQKPERRQRNGLAPWVKLIYAQSCLAPDGAALLDAAATESTAPANRCRPLPPAPVALLPPVNSSALRERYQACLDRLRIHEQYPSPDWSIVDRWVARALLETGAAPAQVAAVLRHGSPGFPRRHADPEDYLRRTLRSAALFSRAPDRRLFD